MKAEHKTGERRAESGLEHWGEWILDARRREIYFNRRLLKLSANQYDLLCYFLRNAGSVVSRNDICLALLNREYNGLDRMIDIQISRLRRLLHDSAAQPRHLKTVRGRGYLFCVHPPL